MSTPRNRHQQAFSPAPFRAGVSGDSSERGDGRGIYPQTGPRLRSFRAAHRRAAIWLRTAPAYASDTDLASYLVTHDECGLTSDAGWLKFARRELKSASSRTPHKQESMVDTVDYYLDHHDEVPQGMRAEFERERATVKKPATTTSASDRAGIEVLNAADWLDSTPDPVDMILSDAADMGTKIVLIAQSKFRKSFFLLQLSIFLAYGEQKFLAWNIPKRRRVLFVNLEITPPHFHGRGKRMLKSTGLTIEQIGDRLHILNGRGQSAAAILRSLPGLVQKYKIDVVILDPVYKLIDGDESKQECVKELLREFDGLCSQTGCALIYAHHCGKGESGDRLAIDRASGSGVLARDFDTQISLTPHLEDGLIVVEQIARSYPPREPFCIQWDDAGFFRMREDATPVIRTSFNRSKSGRVGKALTDDDALDALGGAAKHRKVFIEALRQRGFTVRHAEATLERMEREGVLESITPADFPRRTFFGTPGMIEAIRQEALRKEAQRNRGKHP